MTTEVSWWHSSQDVGLSIKELWVRFLAWV